MANWICNKCSMEKGIQPPLKYNENTKEFVCTHNPDHKFVLEDGFMVSKKV